jgi:hypothetical protein
MQWKTVTCGVLSLIFVVLPGHAQSRTEKPAALLSNAGNISYGNVPLMFEANQGQTDSQACAAELRHSPPAR